MVLVLLIIHVEEDSKTGSLSHTPSKGVPGGSDSCNAGDAGLIPGLGVDTHSGILAWRIPWTEEPGGL